MRLLISFVLLFFLLLPSQTFAWFGAGNTSGWENTVDGLKGKVSEPFYTAAPASYQTNQNINLKFFIENPLNNLSSINKPIYLKIFKVKKSNNQNIEGDNSKNNSFSELDLYNNHNSGNDEQVFHKIVNGGTLILSPGQSTEFTLSFNISDVGYYQFDLTDIGESEPYAPGHIFAAGFIRINNSSSDNNSNSNGNSGSFENSSSGSPARVLGITIAQNISDRFFRNTFTAPETEASEGTQEATESGDILGVTTGSGETLVQGCNQCYFWSLVTFEVLTLVLFLWLSLRFSLGKRFYFSLTSPVATISLFMLVNKGCMHTSIFCKYFWVVAGVLFLLNCALYEFLKRKNLLAKI